MEYLHPTHSCFDDACEMLELLALRALELEESFESQNWLLAHGILTATVNCASPLEPGDLYAHAWVEQDGQAFHAGLLRGEKVWCRCSATDWYTYHHATDVTLYTMRQLVELNTLHANTGPWEERYKSLCRKEPTHAS
jgi:hypothetical protein